VVKNLRSVFGWASKRSAGQARTWAWVSLASEILIVVTGGVVRLTGSGLGCTDWPECTPGHITTTQEQGIHGAIEFGNRALTGVLILIAIATVLAVRGAALRSATRMAWILIAGIAVQAVVGGVTVWIKLIPWLVGVHFVLSALMIVLSCLLVWRVYQPEHRTMPQLAYRLATPLAWVGGLVVLIGVLTTGSGPHAGDANSVRNGLSFELVAKFHSVPAYLLLIIELVVFAVLLRHDLRRQPRENRIATNVVGGLLALTIAQAILGVFQTYLVEPAVPALLVGFHMLGAACMVAMLTFAWLTVHGKNLDDIAASKLAATV
jgi:cytochrome c oxidase assembly protein subunit 15